MSFTFTPKTEQELNASRFIADGEYPFEIKTAQDKMSKAGNPMIEMEVLVFLPDGRSRQLRDWLMPQMEFKLFHFCYYTGLGPKYQQGRFDSSDCIGRQGYAKIVLRKDGSGNEIKDYVRGPEMKKPEISTRSRPTDAQLANQSEGPTEEAPF